MSARGHPGRELERRLDRIREEAARTGRVEADAAPVVGGPIPISVRPPEELRARPGYYGRPVVKAPVWTWEIPLYFTVGGIAGMAGVLALTSLVADGSSPLVRTALRVAAVGALLSPVLLIADLGRPRRFLNMLRVFKGRSPMSVGAWTLAVFSGLAVASVLVAEGAPRLAAAGLPAGIVNAALFALVAATALAGALLATYTGVLLGATAIPAWFSHHRLLPLHFGITGLGGAAALLELLGFRLAALHGVGIGVAAAETAVGASVELWPNGPADRALREGRSGLLLRLAGVLAGPLPLVLRLLDMRAAAAACFLIGSLLSRYGWLAAGRASALDPEAALAAPPGPTPRASTSRTFSP